MENIHEHICSGSGVGRVALGARELGLPRKGEKYLLRTGDEASVGVGDMGLSWQLGRAVERMWG